MALNTTGLVEADAVLDVDTPVSTGLKLHDPNVTIEEYFYWAKLSRADERYEDPNHDYKLFGKVLKKSRRPPATDPSSLAGGPSEKVNGEKDGVATNAAIAENGQVQNVTDEEYVMASRAMRNATWGAVFYLITTDILGPFATPWAFAAVSRPVPVAGSNSGPRPSATDYRAYRWATVLVSSCSLFSACWQAMVASCYGNAFLRWIRIATRSRAMRILLSGSMVKPSATSSTSYRPSSFCWPLESSSS